MITVARSFEWDMGHRVTNHDSLCKNPHGHRYRMVVRVGGDVSTEQGSSGEGMVIDFGLLKKIIEEKIVAKLDHSFVYWEKDKVMGNFAADNPDLRLHAVGFVPTAERLVEDIAKQLTSQLARSYPALVLHSIELFETPKSSAIWERT